MSEEIDSSKHFCYLCGEEITEANKSEEHIILNALGGRLKSLKLLCKKCNSNLGDKEDAALAKQMEFFATHLNIKRERGNLQHIEMTKEGSGEKYLVSSDGVPFLKHPLVEKKENEGKLEFKIRANNEKEALEILTNLQRKYPKTNFEQCKSAIKKVKERLDAPLHIQLCFGGMDAMLSILKTAVNFYIDRSGDIDSVKLAIDDLKKKETDRVEQFLEKSHPLFETSDQEILHSIFINGSKEKNKLYAIVEFFSALQFIVKLSDDYKGEDIQYLYVYDVLNTKEILKEIKNIPAFDFIFDYKYSPKFDFQGLQQKITRVLQIGAKRQNDNRISDIINQSIKAAWGEPDGRVLKEEDANALVNELMKRITPLIVGGTV